MGPGFLLRRRKMMMLIMVVLGVIVVGILTAGPRARVDDSDGWSSSRPATGTLRIGPDGESAATGTSTRTAGTKPAGIKLLNSDRTSARNDLVALEAIGVGKLRLPTEDDMQLLQMENQGRRGDLELAYALLLAEASKENVKIADKQVDEFLADRGLDTDTVYRALRDDGQNVSKESLRAVVRSWLAITSYAANKTAADPVTPAETKQLYRDIFEKISLRIVRLKPDDLNETTTRPASVLKAEDIVKAAATVGLETAAKDAKLDVFATKPFPRKSVPSPRVGSSLQWSDIPGLDLPAGTAGDALREYIVNEAFKLAPENVEPNQAATRPYQDSKIIVLRVPAMAEILILQRPADGFVPAPGGEDEKVWLDRIARSLEFSRKQNLLAAWYKLANIARRLDYDLKQK